MSGNHIVIDQEADADVGGSVALETCLCPRNGPAKSTCMRLHGKSGQTHGWSGAVGGLD